SRVGASDLALPRVAVVAGPAGRGLPARLARLAAARGGARPAGAVALAERRGRPAPARAVAALPDLPADASRPSHLRDPDRALARPRIVLRRPGQLAPAQPPDPPAAVGAQHHARPPPARPCPGDRPVLLGRDPGAFARRSAHPRHMAVAPAARRARAGLGHGGMRHPPSRVPGPVRAAGHEPDPRALVRRAQGGQHAARAHRDRGSRRAVRTVIPQQQPALRAPQAPRFALARAARLLPGAPGRAVARERRPALPRLSRDPPPLSPAPGRPPGASALLSPPGLIVWPSPRPLR